MSEPRERCAVRLFAHARDERGCVVQDPVLKRPGAAPWFARALPVMPQVGEPHSEPGRTETMPHPSGLRSVAAVQPTAAARACPGHEKDGRTAIPTAAPAMQRQLDAS